MANTGRLKYLFQRYISGIETNAERDELMLLIADEGYKPEVTALLDNAFEQLAGTGKLDEEQTERVFAGIRKHSRNEQPAGIYPIPGNYGRLKKIAVAAAAIIILSWAGYFILLNKNEAPALVQTNRSVIDDVPAPDKTRATITLADGRIVYLDSAGNGPLAHQGNTQVIKLPNGQIAYQLSAAGRAEKQLRYNTLSNPRGSTVIDMQLADGTHVWLNAGSSITYPVAFTGNQRHVELKGEGYFEVAKDPAKKFIVTANGTATEVLGTRFNVNAYDDEPETKITLLEGSVKVSRENRHSELDSESVIQGTSGQVRNARKIVTLQPGQQAAIHHSSFIIHHSIDTEQVMAWKNGLFNFEGCSFAAVMRQLERWYNIAVVYENKVPGIELSGKMTKDVTLKGVMVILTRMGVQYEMQGNKLLIKGAK